MLSRLLLATVLFLTLIGTAALTLTGCDDDPGVNEPDLSAVDLATPPDLRMTGG